MNYYDKETLKKIHTDETVIIEGYDGKIHITREYIGDIYLPTGEIVAFDPVRRYENYLSNKSPFIDKVLSGRYPVYIYYAEKKEVAFVEVVFKEKVATNYIPALNKVDSHAKVKPGKEFGFTIFSNETSITDMATLHSINIEAIRKGLYSEGTVVNHEFISVNEKGLCYGENIYSNDGRNVFTFNVGNLNFCPSFWGIDSKDNKCCLIIDFMLHK